MHSASPILLDLAFVLVFQIVFLVVGLPFARAPGKSAPPHFRLLSATLGSGIVSVAATILYIYGVSIRQCFILACAVGAILLARELRRGLPALKKDFLEYRLSYAVWGANLLMMLLPKWIGGLQFSAFQGNIGDQLWYMSAATMFSTDSYASIMQLPLDMSRWDQQPLVYFARQSAINRPTNHIFYALTSQLAPESFFRLSYTHNALLFSQTTLAIAFLSANVFKTSLRAGLILGSVFTLGFWGQYIVDINAWGHMASASILVLTVGLAALIFADRRKHFKKGILGDRALFAVFTLVLIAGLYTYAEGWASLIAALALTLMSTLLSRKERSRETYRALGFFVTSGLATAAFTAALTYEQVIGFLFRQAQWALQGGTIFTADGRVSWYQYFQKFLLGNDGQWTSGALGNAVELFWGVVGMYFITPPSDWPQEVRVAGLTLLGAAAIAILVPAYGLVKRSIPKPDAAAIFTRCAVFQLALAAYYALDARYWAAGKQLSFASACLVLLLTVPFFLKETRRLPRAVIGALIAGQFFFAAKRLAGATEIDGVHYDEPYPAAQDRSLKKTVRLELAQLVEPAKRCRRVNVDIPHLQLNQYVTIFLHSLGKDGWVSSASPPGSQEGSLCVVSLVPFADAPEGARDVRQFALSVK